MGKLSTEKQTPRNKNLRLVAKITIYGYNYVKQVACGDRNNYLISKAIKAVNDGDLEAQLQINTERKQQIELSNSSKSNPITHEDY